MQFPEKIRFSSRDIMLATAAATFFPAVSVVRSTILTLERNFETFQPTPGSYVNIGIVFLVFVIVTTPLFLRALSKAKKTGALLLLTLGINILWWDFYREMPLKSWPILLTVLGVEAAIFVGIYIWLKKLPVKTVFGYAAILGPLSVVVMLGIHVATYGYMISLQTPQFSGSRLGYVNLFDEWQASAEEVIGKVRFDAKNGATVEQLNGHHFLHVPGSEIRDVVVEMWVEFEKPPLGSIGVEVTIRVLEGALGFVAEYGAREQLYAERGQKKANPVIIKSGSTPDTVHFVFPPGESRKKIVILNGRNSNAPIRAEFLAVKMFAIGGEKKNEAMSRKNNHAGNVYHVILDQYNSKVYERLIMEYPEFKFPGFKFFRNNAASANLTKWALAQFLGKYSIEEMGDVLFTHWLAPYDTGLGHKLWENGIAIRQYVSFPRTCSYIAVCFTMYDNDPSFKRTHQVMMIDLSIIANLPNGLRPIQNGSIFGHVQSDNDWAYGFSPVIFAMQAWAQLGGADYNPSTGPYNYTKGSHDNFYTALEMEEARPDTGQYVFIHTLIPHWPLIKDEDCNYFLAPPDSSPIPQYLCATRMIGLLVERLKELDRYENSLIIVHGDHGDMGWYRKKKSAILADLKKFSNDETPEDTIDDLASALMLVKFPGSNEFSVSDLPVQLIDVTATVLEHFAIPGDEFPGTAMQSMGEDFDRIQAFHYYYYPTIEGPSAPEYFSKFEKLDGKWTFVKRLETY